MCKHAYITKQRIYYDKGCRVIREYDTCIFCGRKTEERLSYMNDPPKRKLPYFGPHFNSHGARRKKACSQVDATRVNKA